MPTIEAVIHSLFHFSDRALALEKFFVIRDQYIITEDHTEDREHPRFKIWIKQFDITPREEAEGHLGNFAMISVKPLSGADFTVHAEKIVTPLDQHPQRRKRKYKHPNLGHPVVKHASDCLVFSR